MTQSDKFQDERQLDHVRDLDDLETQLWALRQSVWRDLARIRTEEEARVHLDAITLHTITGPTSTRAPFQSRLDPKDERERLFFRFPDMLPEQVVKMIAYLELHDGRTIFLAFDKEECIEAPSWLVRYKVYLARAESDTVARLEFLYAEVEECT